MAVPANPFAGRLLSEIARHKGGMPAACAEMGVSPQDIDALASGRAPSRVVLEAMYEWLGGRQALMKGELEDYERLRDSARQAAVAIPSGAPDAQQATASRPGTSHRALIAAATATAVVIIAMTVALTVVITRPGRADTSTEATSPPTETSPSGSSSAAAVSASPTATSRKTTAPATASGSPAPSSPATPGELIGSYNNFQLSCDFTLAFGSGGAPQPVAWGSGLTNDDLDNDCAGASVNADPNMFDTTTGEVALLTGAPTYANCAGDTDLGGGLESLVQGNTICYQGHGVLAAATIVALGSGGGNDYAELDVQVWRYPQADPQGNSGS
jgi:hypothetical protein